MIRIDVSDDAASVGERAAAAGGRVIHEALARDGAARIVLATGVSQFAMLAHLVRRRDIDWSRVTAFHLDEYVGLSAEHSASFRRYLQERFVAHAEGVRFVPIDGVAAPEAEIARLGALIEAAPIDVCFAGLGENCHLAFNDPPADFATRAPFLLVTLDEACRRQQLGEGWFGDLDEVPRTALSMSVDRIMRSRVLVLSVPEARKAVAVRDMMTRPIDPMHPGTIVREHPDAYLFLDPASARLLEHAR